MPIEERACHDPANELLIWYLNGSLEGKEEELVRLHLATCDVCMREADELSQIGRHIEENPTLLRGGTPGERVEASGDSKDVRAIPGVEKPGPAPSARRIRPALAAAVLVAALVLFWYSGRRGPGTGAPPSEGSIVTLDLGAGTPRGGESYPRLVVGRDVREVRLSFVAPVNPDASYGIEIHGPLGGIVARQDRAALPLDPQGRSEYAARADRFSAPGDYDLILREFAPRGETHEYHYPFRVGRPDRP